MRSKRKTENINQLWLHILFGMLCLLMLFPFLLVVSVSLSNEMDIVNFGYKVLPIHIDFSAYQYVFRNPVSILDAYKVTIAFSVIYTVLSVLLMAELAFLLSKRGLKGKRLISLYIYFTMLFNGGLVPTYILIAQVMNLSNTIWVYILPGLISPWFVFMMRTFFQGVPYEITESAIMDGANEYAIFLKMILPLSKPVLAAVALFMFLGKWNDWYTSMLYIDKEELVSLQYLLQRIMQNIQLLKDNAMNLGLAKEETKVPTETVRMAMAVVVAGPALLVFPFFQKYFVKGLTVGSVKG